MDARLCTPTAPPVPNDWGPSCYGRVVRVPNLNEDCGAEGCGGDTCVSDIAEPFDVHRLAEDSTPLPEDKDLQARRSARALPPLWCANFAASTSGHGRDGVRRSSMALTATTSPSSLASSRRGAWMWPKSSMMSSGTLATETPRPRRNLTVGMSSQPLPDPLQESIWNFVREQVRRYENKVGARSPSMKST